MVRLKMVFMFLISIAALLLALMFFNQIPIPAGKEAVRSFRTIEDMRAELRLNKVFMPSYFPQYLKWPPSEIYGAGKPLPRLIIHFSHRDTGDIVLAISQTHSQGTALPSRIEPARIKKEETVVLKGRQARVSLALCSDNKPCNKVTWQEGQYIITIIARDSIEEMLKVAESALYAE